MALIGTLINGVELSENAMAIISGAEALARQRGHSILGTEHVIFHMVRAESRAMHWIADATFPGNPSAVAKLQDTVIDWLESRPIFTPQPEIQNLLVVSEALSRSISIAVQIGSRPIRDGDIVYANGLIASEFLLAGILVEGTGLGAEALTRNSRGRVNSYAILEALQLDPNNILRPDSGEGAWNEFSLDSVVTSDECIDFNHWNPFDGLSPLDIMESGSLPAAPTDGSNWLIPDHLIIGSEPSNSDAKALAEAGIDTFVCLIKYYGDDPMYHRTHRYPATFQHHNSSRPLHFVHFPIRDFHVTSTQSLNKLVIDLKRRLLEGHRVFIHCAGGHG